MVNPRVTNIERIYLKLSKNLNLLKNNGLKKVKIILHTVEIKQDQQIITGKVAKQTVIRKKETIHDTMIGENKYLKEISLNVKNVAIVAGYKHTTLHLYQLMKVKYGTLITGLLYVYLVMKKYMVDLLENSNKVLKLYKEDLPISLVIPGTI